MDYPNGPSTPSGVSVDYAVFTPGTFDSKDLDPTGSFAYSSKDYVYAYELINTSGQTVGDFSVHFDASLPEPIIDSVGEANPNGTAAQPFASIPYAMISDIPGTDSTEFVFNAGISAGQNSEFIFEASKYSPIGNPDKNGNIQPSYIVPPSYNYAYLPSPWSDSGSPNAMIGQSVPLPVAWLQGLLMLAVLPLASLVSYLFRRRPSKNVA